MIDRSAVPPTLSPSASPLPRAGRPRSRGHSLLQDPRAMKMLVTIAATLSIVISASAAMASSFSGNYPVTVTHSQHSNFRHCLTLTDNGTLGWPHSGPAVLDGRRDLGGSFQIIGPLIEVVTNQGGGQSGQNAAAVYSATVGYGKFDTGTFEQIYGGASADSGVVTFGMKGGC